MSLDKIKKDIFERTLSNSVGYLPQNGKSVHEFDHRFCSSNLAEMKDYIIVVSKSFVYNNQSLDDFTYNYYVYDKNGNFINDPKILSKCKGTFIDTLKDIE